uniref:Copine C-terminal domain-containing protein n=1 Tax=Percolomonas cosmopolitus TaxID=63605 RepID=A0A7S1KMX3_9EUKA
MSHCFALNGNANDPSCDGIQGIVSAYEQALHSVQLYGPTFFSEIIRKASDLASGYVSQDVQQYHVLLLLTDGLVNDMDKTVEEICRASTLPLSIIIVGVGNADFSKMDFLDSDDGKLRSNSTGRVAQRDIVQFVPFNRFKHNPHAFASAVLAELPHQVEEYFKVKGISPNQACVVDVNDIQITEGAMGSGLPDFQPFNQGSQQQGQQQMYPQQPQQSYNQQGQYQQQNYNHQGQYPPQQQPNPYGQ